MMSLEWFDQLKYQLVELKYWAVEYSTDKCTRNVILKQNQLDNMWRCCISESHTQADRRRVSSLRWPIFKKKANSNLKPWWKKKKEKKLACRICHTVRSNPGPGSHDSAASRLHSKHNKRRHDIQQRTCKKHTYIQEVTRNKHTCTTNTKGNLHTHTRTFGWTHEDKKQEIGEALKQLVWLEKGKCVS